MEYLTSLPTEARNSFASRVMEHVDTDGVRLL